MNLEESDFDAKRLKRKRNDTPIRQDGEKGNKKKKKEEKEKEEVQKHPVKRTHLIQL